MNIFDISNQELHTVAYITSDAPLKIVKKESELVSQNADDAMNFTLALIQNLRASGFNAQDITPEYDYLITINFPFHR